ncbi:MAG: S-methyl-5-thioribose-1-phosphate isomerase, partial [candidate division WOR-3 bacterium]
SAASHIMKTEKIRGVFTGADRIARNGDTANKIGTYSLALSAKENKIPFYIVAPGTTFDLTLKNGREIPIEERTADEVTEFMGERTAPDNIKVKNPAFDVTPQKFISGIITEKGIIYPPFEKNIGIIQC